MLPCSGEKTHSFANHQQPSIQFSTIKHRNSIYSKYSLLIGQFKQRLWRLYVLSIVYYMTTASFEYFIISQTSSNIIQERIHKESTKSFQLLLTIHIVPEIDPLLIVTGLSLKNRMKSHCDSNEYGMQPITRQMDSIGYLNKQLLSTICNVQVIDENEPVHCVTCVLTDDLAHSIVRRWYRCIYDHQREGSKKCHTNS